MHSTAANIVFISCAVFTFVAIINTSAVSIATEERMVLRVVKEIEREIKLLSASKGIKRSYLIGVSRVIGRKMKKFARKFRLNREMETKMLKLYADMKTKLKKLKDKFKKRYTGAGVTIPRRIVRPASRIGQRRTLSSTAATVATKTKITSASLSPKTDNKRSLLPLSSPMSTGLPHFFSAPPFVSVFRKV